LKQEKDAFMINSIVGENTKLKGEFEIDGILRIDGIFHGSVKGKTQVLIGERGEAYIDLEADEMVIGGKVEGNIRLRGKIQVLPSGFLKGEITASNIIIEPGATFQGKCTMRKEH
jgi:cytoskeletal protein CcmA (bactofilin family)